MNLMLRRSAYLGVVALLALSATLAASVARGAGGQGKMAASALNVDWPRFGNTTDNWRFSPLTQINTSNVSKLGVAWTMQEGNQIPGWETDPIVVHGVMYVTTGTDQVIAVDAATGHMLWKYTPSVNFYEAIAGGGGGVPANRGVAVANGAVYVLTFDDHLIALQAATGEKLWSTRVSDAKLGYSESSVPTYWNGMLFVGSAGSDSGLRGFVAAYDAHTGKQLWRFYTVPASGQGWNPAQGEHGGGDVWMPPTIDTRSGILYIATGNPSPDFVNAMRQGCDPYVDATVALDARTGKLLWWHSQACPDVWDFDSAQPPILFTVHRNGKAIPAVGEGNKSGYYWIFDAKTGDVLAKSPSVVKQTTPRPYPNAKGVVVCPGQAGIEYGPASYSPRTQAVYVGALDSCARLQTVPISVNKHHKRGQIDTGASYNPYGKLQGTMTAIDVNTGKFLWHDHLPSQLVGGNLVTGGNLVFSGSDHGTFYAFDAKTGKILWHPNVGLAFGAAPIAYMVNGTEYVAVASGGAGVSEGKVGGTLFVFKLGGRPIKAAPEVTPGVVPKDKLPSLKGRIKINPWMYVAPHAHNVVIEMVAGATPNNSGFNFDGYAKGQANFVVPAGWGVTIEFSNRQSLPHSLAIASTLTPPVKVAVFGFGPEETGDAIAGIHPGLYQVLGLSPNPANAGRYYVVCMVPGHIQSGMWDYFTISATAKMPSIQTK
jgi:PQQ-dependent dehydrogenase (methanol/ethanol family)